jgi:hypothetical protein
LPGGCVDVPTTFSSAAVVHGWPLTEVNARNLTYRPVLEVKVTVFSVALFAKVPVATAAPQFVPSVLT